MSSLSPLAATINVAIGGAFGAALRYQTGRAMTAWMGAPMMGAFPWATLAVNAVGSFAMGLLAGWLVRQGGGGDQVRLLIGIGLLGGFTTFSAFSLEMSCWWNAGSTWWRDFTPFFPSRLASPD